MFARVRALVFVRKGEKTSNETQIRELWGPRLETKSRGTNVSLIKTWVRQSCGFKNYFFLPIF